MNVVFHRLSKTRVILISLILLIITGLSQVVLAATLTGGEGNDRLIGTNSSDTINGRSGNDYIEGRGGADTISGGAGGDTIYGGEGDDDIEGDYGGYRSNQIAETAVLQSPRVEPTATSIPNPEVIGDTIYGGNGNDTIRTNIGNDTVYGEDGDDSISPGDNAYWYSATIFGGDGHDYINFQTRLGSIDAGSGNDTVIGTAASVILGNGDDVFSYNRRVYPDFPTVLDGGEGYDQLRAGWGLNMSGVTNVEFISAEDIIVANDNMPPGGKLITIGTKVDASTVTSGIIDCTARECYGGSGGDTFTGSISSDIFQGNGGNDSINGGDGRDVAMFSGNAIDYLIVELAYNTFTVTDLRTGSPDGVDTIVDVNVLRFADGDQEVVIAGLSIIGDDTNEELNGSPNADLLDGAGGNDVVDGDIGNDTLLGGQGNDVLIAGAGNDTFDGGAGDDTYNVSTTSSVTVNLQSQRATGVDIGTDDIRNIENVVGSSASDTLIGNAIANQLSGGESDDTIDGDAGNDTVDGSAGNDTLLGGQGNDVLIAGAGNDTFDGGAGDDTYNVSTTSSVTVNLQSQRATGVNIGTDVIRNIENIVGSSANDTVIGNAAVNLLDGARGNDALTGGLGRDVMTGGIGKDRFIYIALLDSKVGSSGRDVISDFNGTSGDSIDLSAIDAYTGQSGNQAFVYIGTSPFSGKRGEVRFSGGILQINTGRDLIADMEIMLTGVRIFDKRFIVP
ncbi:MAG: calcium-binding protein [Chloroflexota bacterium]|jgi:Ca2+-binding RTX toxin-like protein